MQGRDVVYEAFREKRRRRPFWEQLIPLKGEHGLVMLQYLFIWSLLLGTLLLSVNLLRGIMGSNEIILFFLFPHLVFLILLNNENWFRVIIMRPPVWKKQGGVARFPSYCHMILAKDRVERRLMTELWLAGMSCRDFFRAIALEALEKGDRTGRRNA